MKGDSDERRIITDGRRIEQIAAGIRKMVVAQEKAPEKEAKPVKKAEKKNESVPVHQRKKQRLI